MTRPLVIVLVLIGLAGCDRNTPAFMPSTSPPTVPFPLPAEDVRPSTHEGLAAGFCDRWLSTPLDLSALHAGSSDVVSVERDGRGGLTLAAVAVDGSATAMAIGSDGRLAETVHLTPPTSDGTGPTRLAHVQAAPAGAWVLAWSGGVNGLYRRDPDGALVRLDVEDPTNDARTAIDFGVSEDGWIGVSDMDGVRYIPLGGGTPVVVLSRWLFGIEASAWFDGRLVALVAQPDPEMQSVSMDGSFDAVPVPYLDVLPHQEPILGPDSRSFASILHDDPTSLGVAITTPTVPDARYALDVSFDVLGGGVARSSSGGVALVGSQRGLTGPTGSPVELIEVAPDGTRSAVTTLGTMPAAPTSVSVAATSDGDTLLVHATNASLARAWIARCEDGGI